MRMHAQLSSVYDEVMISRDEVYISQCQLLTHYNHRFLVKHKIVQVHQTLYIPGQVPGDVF